MIRPPMKEIEIDFSNLPIITNECYFPYYTNTSRYLVFYGGAGSGKSVFVAQKLIFRMLTEEKHKFLVVRKVAKTLRQSTFSLLKQTIYDWGMEALFTIHEGDMTIICNNNGNQIIHAGLDDVEKLKSIHGVTSIWIEEASEILQEDFQQLDLRLRGFTQNYKQIILSFNPISITHWLKRVFFDGRKANSSILKTTFKDNKFLDAEYINTLMELELQDPYYFTVYALGEWGVLGKTIFNSELVTKRIYALRDRKPLRQGYFEFNYEGQLIVDSSIQWVDDPKGFIRIYEEVQPGYPYVAGGDTAGEGSDFFTGHIINNVTGIQAAVLHQDVDEDLYARQMYCLGRHYNDALIGIEMNFSTHPNKELQRLGYQRMYMREIIDRMTNEIDRRIGFRTDKITRPLIIANLVQIVRERPELFNDIATLEEMLTFVRNENGRAEAQDGSHDDLIMGLAITYYIRDQQSFSVEVDKKEQPVKLIDKLERRRRKAIA